MTRLRAGTPKHTRNAATAMRWAMQSLLGLLIALHITWAAAAPAFVLNVVAPDDVQPTLARHLDIQRFANLPDLDANELQRLVADVPVHARSLLKTVA